MGQFNTCNPIYICKKVIERTNPILDTLATWYTWQAFFVLNACEQSCVMMIMGGSIIICSNYHSHLVVLLHQWFLQKYDINISSVYHVPCFNIRKDNLLYDLAKSRSREIHIQNCLIGSSAAMWLSNFNGIRWLNYLASPRLHEILR